MPFEIDNTGIGGSSLLTLTVDAAPGKDFSHADLAANRTACTISGNNEAGMGVGGHKLFGKVLAISEEQIPGKPIPRYCTVQARGVARFRYVATTPVINQMVEVNGAGAVKQVIADAAIAAGGHLGRGIVINVITATTEVDVWLG